MTKAEEIKKRLRWQFPSEEFLKKICKEIEKDGVSKFKCDTGCTTDLNNNTLAPRDLQIAIDIANTEGFSDYPWFHGHTYVLFKL